MSQIDETTVDVEDVIQRVQAVRRGELPESAVSMEELRAAVAAQRRLFAAAPAGKALAEKKTISTKTKLQIDLDGI